MNNVKIMVCYSFDSEIVSDYKNSKFIKFGAGNYKSKDMDFSEDDGYNIKDTNPYLNECTMIYWMIKNYDKIGNPDYIGCNHYRRNLQYDESKLNENTIFCDWGILGPTIYKQFVNSHSSKYIDMFVDEYKKIFPENSNIIDEFFSQEYMAGANLFLMSRKAFLEYSEHFLKCIEICKKFLADFNFDIYGNYQKRQLSFIMERINGFWMYKAKKYSSFDVIGSKYITYNIQSPHR